LTGSRAFLGSGNREAIYHSRHDGAEISPSGSV
jgi:hypothetical protein